MLSFFIALTDNDNDSNNDYDNDNNSLFNSYPGSGCLFEKTYLHALQLKVTLTIITEICRLFRLDHQYSEQKLYCNNN